MERHYLLPGGEAYAGTSPRMEPYEKTVDAGPEHRRPTTPMRGTGGLCQLLKDQEPKRPHAMKMASAR